MKNVKIPSIVLTTSALAVLATGSVSHALQGASSQLGAVGRSPQSGFPKNASVIPTAEPTVTPISALPFTITQPGYYRVTKNLTGVAGQGGIVITTSNRVVIDLNGFSLGGVPGSEDGISSPGEAVVFNGTIHDWQRGLAIFGEAEVSGVNVVLNAGVGMFLPGIAYVERCAVSSNGGDGIQGNRLVVRDSAFIVNGGDGIDAGDEILVEGCRFLVNTENGVLMKDRGTVNRCALEDNGQAGISGNSDCTVSDCKVVDNDIVGIVFKGSLGRIERCVARNNFDGFDLGAGQIVDSEAIDNTAHGIVGRPGASVVRCTSTANSVGIAMLGVSGRVAECTVEENLSHGVSVFGGALVANNSIRSNAGSGIVANDDGNRIEQNHVSANGLGIQVVGQRNLIVRNSLDGNGVQMQIAPDNVEGPFLKTKGFVQNENPWANFDLSFPGTFP